MHSLFFSGQKKIEIGRGGVDRNRSNHEADAQKEQKAFRRQGRQAAHHPVRSSPKITPRQSRHKKHDDGGEKRGRDDTAKKQSVTVYLAASAPEIVNGSNRDGSPHESPEGGDEAGELRRQ